MRSSVDVHNRLLDLNIRHELVALPGSVRDSDSMAEILGLSPGSVIKTLVWLVEETPILTIVPGDRQVDRRKLRQVVSASRLTPAPNGKVTEITGYLAGAIPPLGWKTDAAVYIDSAVMTNDIVYGAGGQPNIVLKIRASDLVAACGATLADIAK